MNHYKEKPNGSYRGDNFVGVYKERIENKTGEGV